MLHLFSHYYLLPVSFLSHPDHDKTKSSKTNSGLKTFRLFVVCSTFFLPENIRLKIILKQFRFF